MFREFCWILILSAVYITLLLDYLEYFSVYLNTKEALTYFDIIWKQSDTFWKYCQSQDKLIGSHFLWYLHYKLEKSKELKVHPLLPPLT